MKYSSLLKLKVLNMMSIALLALVSSFSLSAYADIQNESYNRVPGTNVYFDNGVTESEASDVFKYWGIIPENIRTALRNNGVSLYLISTRGANQPGLRAVSQAVKDKFGVNNSGIGTDGVYYASLDDNSYLFAPISEYPDFPDMRKATSEELEAGSGFYIITAPDGKGNVHDFKLRGTALTVINGYIMPKSFAQSGVTFEIPSDFSTADYAEITKDPIVEFNPTDVSAQSIHPGLTAFSDGSVKFKGPLYTEYYTGRKGELYNPQVVVHEAGHQLDFVSVKKVGYKGSIFGFSDTPTWSALYEKYKDAVTKIDKEASVNTYNVHEFYAECFRLACVFPDKLKNVAPECYNEIMNEITMF